MTNLQIIRDRMQHLTYSEIMMIAEWFAAIDKPGDELNDSSFWAYSLNEWAHNAVFPEDDDSAEDQP